MPGKAKQPPRKHWKTVKTPDGKTVQIAIVKKGQVDGPADGVHTTRTKG